jgi:hypothetical protein
MRAAAKIGLVAAGYVGAFLVASAVVAVYVASTSGQDRQTYGAMYDFGDSLLFLAVLGVAAVPATGAALFFLRPHRSFWLAICAAPAVAVTALVAMIECVAAQGAGGAAAHTAWSALAVLRILASPLFAGAFFLAALLAPGWAFRLVLFSATLIEMLVCGWVTFTWFHPFQAN